jgi:GH43 family beta-xylosidase
MALVYRNPVWPGTFADPFVLRSGEHYYAYGTGEGLVTKPGRPLSAFEVLRSRDLVEWESLGGALPVARGFELDAFWAPAVAERNGRFLLYYSRAPAGRDELHRLYVAASERPEGPFADVGRVLPEREGFSIDAHPFQDARDGRWYLFFAKDFFDERAGTGLAVVPLNDDLLRTTEPSRPVLRANHDWQIYDRSLYGRMWPAWHTVEGPCVVAHAGRCYCFYSGGNWQTRDYGVSYAVADHPLGPWSHAPHEGPVVLRERGGEVLGPGHNSHVVGPDGRTEFLVYHAWDASRTKRRMCLDRLEWTPQGPRCLGPTTEPQPLTV